MTIFGGEIIRITDTQTLFGQETLNVYYYLVGTDLGGTTALEVAEGWWTNFSPELLACQHEELNHVSVKAESLDGSMDYGVFIIPTGDGNGLLTGSDCNGPNFAYGITLQPANRSVRPGGKRIAGVPEGVVSNGGVLEPTIVTLLDDFVSQITAPVSLVGFLDVLLPVIVGFPHPASPTGRPARLTRVEVPVVAGLVSPYVTTQNSRKYGRGS